MLGTNPNLMITDYTIPKQILKIFLSMNYPKVMQNEINMNMSASKAVQEHMLQTCVWEVLG